MNTFGVDCEKEVCDRIGPSSTDVWIHEDDCNVQADIKVEKIRTTLLWGYVTDRMDTPVEDATVTLLRLKNGYRCEEVCLTHTDCTGYYQFELPFDMKGSFRVAATKSRCMGGRSEEPCSPGGYHGKKKQNNISYY